MKEIGVFFVQCISSDTLQEFVEKARPFSRKGTVPHYIPALTKAEQTDLSVALYTNEGCVSAGDVSKRFTLQSVSKIITLALAIHDLGRTKVFEKVGMEPTGDPFNSIAKLENQTPSKPLNPMINAGALTVTHLIQGMNNEEKLERILQLVRKMANNDRITVNEYVAKSEFETANLNRSLCYFLKEHKVIDGDIEELLNLYTNQCAIELNCIDLAHIGYVLANDGINPYNGEIILSKDITRIVTTFMVTCGMYNESGEFAIKVGIPAKSGVSGAVLSSIPEKMGIGVYGPALNEKGNSIAGVRLLQSLSNQLQLNIF